MEASRVPLKPGCDHAGRVEGHTLTPPQQYCKNFNISVCDHRWVPKGNCLWDATEHTCKPDPRCVHVAIAQLCHQLIRT